MEVVSRDQVDSPIVLEVADWFTRCSVNSGLPVKADFKPRTFSALVIPRLFLTEVTVDPFKVRFRAAGEAVEDSFGMPITGKYLHDLPIPQVAELTAWYQSLIDDFRPIFVSNISSCDGDRMIYQGALFPFTPPSTNTRFYLGVEHFLETPVWRKSVRHRTYGHPQAPKG